MSPSMDKKGYFFIKSFLVLSLLYGLLGSIKHFLCNSNVMDLALFANWSHLISVGLVDEPGSLLKWSGLADHFSILLLPIGSTFKLFNSAYTLIAIQSLGIGLLGAFIASDIRSSKELSHKLKVLMTIGLTLSPFILYQAINDFHPEIFASFAGYKATSTCLRNKKVACSLWLTLFLLSKEINALFGLCLAILAFINRRYIFAALLSLISCSWFSMAMVYIATNNPYDHTKRFSSVINTLSGNTMLNPSNTIFNIPSQEFLNSTLVSIAYVAPLLLYFSPFFTKRGLTAASCSLPFIILNVASDANTMRSIEYQYQIQIFILLVPCLLYGLEGARLNHNSLIGSKRFFEFIITFWIMLSIVSLRLDKFATFYLENSSLSMEVLQLSISSDLQSSVWAHSSIATHFSARRSINSGEIISEPLESDMYIFPLPIHSHQPTGLIKLRNYLLRYGEPEVKYPEGAQNESFLINRGFRCSGNKLQKCVR